VPTLPLCAVAAVAADASAQMALNQEENRVLLLRKAVADKVG
jgi:hypothetical protein